MKEVTAPVIATTLVMVAIFIPVAVMGGITGRLYQQFAITIAISVALSSVNALTLSPALAASLLKAPGEEKSLFDRFFRVILQGNDTAGGRRQAFHFMFFTISIGIVMELL